MNVTIIGIGLIGGSLAIEMRRKKIADKIIGVDKNTENAQKALALCLVDEVMAFQTAVIQADIVVIAVPVDIAVDISLKVLDLIDNQIVFDVGSTKRAIVEAVKNHHKRSHFVATHPMAGTEFSGAGAAVADLFKNKALIICDSRDSSEKALNFVRNIFSEIGMRIIEMESTAHDVHVAYVSHISHISSFALALSVLQKEKNEKNIFNLASGGFESTVRLAKSSVQMWTPIFLQNKHNILEVIDTYTDFLNDFRKAISENDDFVLNNLMKEANKIGMILNETKKENILDYPEMLH